MGTRVPYSGPRVVASWAMVSTPRRLHSSASRRPSSGLPGNSYSMLLMKCGSSLLVYRPWKCGPQLMW
ncbi:hypothetical protein D9M68_1007100 [compost metagenome]